MLSWLYHHFWNLFWLSSHLGEKPKCRQCMGIRIFGTVPFQDLDLLLDIFGLIKLEGLSCKLKEQVQVMTWGDVLKRCIHADKLHSPRIWPLFFILGLFLQSCSVLHFPLVLNELSTFLNCHKTISWKFCLPSGCHFRLYTTLPKFGY